MGIPNASAELVEELKRLSRGDPMPSTSAQTASSQLAELKQQFQACSAATQELVSSVSEADLKQRPPNQGWSIAECIQHLTATTQLYLPILESALQNTPAGHGPDKMDWKGRLLKGVLEPPYRSRGKPMPRLEPKIADVRRGRAEFRGH